MTDSKKAGLKIGIFCGNVIPFHAKSLDQRPLGGTETGVIRLAAALQSLGCEVDVFTPFENPPQSTPRYFHKSAIERAGPFDAYISTRDWIPALYQIQTKKRFLWTGDSYDQFPNFGIGDKRVTQMIDGILAVSHWQAKALAEASGYPLSKMIVIGNGIEPQLFEGEENRKRHRLIYSSTPYRGLEHTPFLFSRLKSDFPDLEFHIFSGYKVYDQNENEFGPLRKKLESIPGCFLHGNIPQKELAREFMKSSLLFYPCHFEETSCITAMEAQAAGCVTVSTHLGALRETVDDAGILIPGLPHEASYQEAYLSACRRLLTDDELFKRLSERGKERAKEMTWTKVAERLIRHLDLNL